MTTAREPTWRELFATRRRVHWPRLIFLVVIPLVGWTVAFHIIFRNWLD